VTFLEIANQVAFLSGTFPSLTAISTVVGQTGRKAKCVNWTNVAWQQIQTIRPDWGWMRTEFTGSILTPTQRFEASDFSITRFSRWAFSTRGDSGLTLYRTSTGVSDEQPVSYMEWDSFRRTYLRGVQAAARPARFTIDSAGQIVLGPYPDYDYTITGEYQKSPQVMTANGDIPEAPVENHWLIVWAALILLAEDDEAVNQDPAWRIRYASELSKLERAQLPKMGNAPSMVGNSGSLWSGW
jgi:hypothetical protein